MWSAAITVRSWSMKRPRRGLEDQLFYCLQRGISEDDAISMIVNGFCKDVFSELPLEFAVEAQKLLAISLEHSVG
jgi:Fe-S cluster assembly protein SufB